MSESSAPKHSATEVVIAYLPMGKSAPPKIKNFQYNPELGQSVWDYDRTFDIADPDDLKEFLKLQEELLASTILRPQRIRIIPAAYCLQLVEERKAEGKRQAELRIEAQAQRDANAAAAASEQKDEEPTGEEVEETPAPESTDTQAPEETPETPEAGDTGPDTQAEEVEEEETDEPLKPYDEWTVPELKEEATARELEFTSKITKAKIIELLEADDAAQAD